MTSMLRPKSGAYWLSWNTTESINCTAQGLITNERTNDVWISCTSYLGRGRLLLDGENGDPIGMTIDLWNMNALDEPRIVSGKEYAHIGDGDYVELENGNAELWFGLEGGSWPRILPGAIARYDAHTLEFVDLHAHPTLKTMAFLAFYQKKQVAYVANWTENDGELLVFDGRTMEWSSQNSSIQGLPIDYKDDIKFIQGADVFGDVLYLMADDFSSTLLAIRIIDVYKGEVESVIHLGLGHEREGMTIFEGRGRQQWLLSMDNQWSTWEDHHFAEIVCVSLSSPIPISAPRWEYAAFGIIIGLGMSLVSLVIARRWESRRQEGEVQLSYIEVVQPTQTTQGIV